jgi:hypothetical protein
LTTTNFLAALINKLVGIRVFVRSEIKDANKHPAKLTHRVQLDGFLRITQAELVEGFGVKNPKKLTLTVRKAMAVLARIHKGSDSYRTIAEKAEALIKRLSPIYKAELECVSLEAAKRDMRRKLEQSFRDLSGGKALPDGFETHVLADLVSDLRDDMVAETVHLMGVCGDKSLFHPHPERINNENLFALHARLKQVMIAKQPVRMSVAPKLREALAD